MRAGVAERTGPPSVGTTALCWVVASLLAGIPALWALFLGPAGVAAAFGWALASGATTAAALPEGNSPVARVLFGVVFGAVCLMFVAIGLGLLFEVLSAQCPPDAYECPL